MMNNLINNLICCCFLFVNLQSPELEFRHELMNRLNKLDTEVELEILPNQHHSSNSPSSSSGLSAYGGQNYDNYGKEYFFGKHRK